MFCNNFRNGDFKYWYFAKKSLYFSPRHSPHPHLELPCFPLIKSSWRHYSSQYKTGQLKILLVIAVAFDFAIALNIPTIGHYNAVTVKEPPKWNFANGATAGAKADGSEGVIIEPDLVEGQTGKDGTVVKEIRFGPYTVQSG